MINGWLRIFERFYLADTVEFEGLVRENWEVHPDSHKILLLVSNV